jgi:hypothetical protein
VLTFPWAPPHGYIMETYKEVVLVEVGSNISTVALRVVRGDEKGSLESETVKYGHESHGTRTREWLRWRGPAANLKDRPVLSSERAPHINKLQLSDSNKNQVVSSIWVLIPRQTGRLTVGRNIRLRFGLRSSLSEVQRVRLKKSSFEWVLVKNWIEFWKWQPKDFEKKWQGKN